MFVYNLQNYSGSGIHMHKSAKSANSGDGKYFVSHLLSKHCHNWAFTPPSFLIKIFNARLPSTASTVKHFLMT